MVTQPHCRPGPSAVDGGVCGLVALDPRLHSISTRCAATLAAAATLCWARHTASAADAVDRSLHAALSSARCTHSTEGRSVADSAHHARAETRRADDAAESFLSEWPARCNRTHVAAAPRTRWRTQRVAMHGQPAADPAAAAPLCSSGVTRGRCWLWPLRSDSSADGLTEGEWLLQ